MAVTPDMNQIATVMSQLQHNYSQLAQNWFTIFYDTTPQDVTITFFDEVGNYETYTVPNRAKDMKNIMNGEGSPEGVVTAGVGVIYQDLENGDAYVKKTGSSNIGWIKFISQTELDKLIRKGSSSPEGNVTGEMGDLFVDKTAVKLYIKTTSTGNTGWIQIDSKLPDQAGNVGKYLKTNGTTLEWSEVRQSPSTDNKSISINASEELQAEGILNQNSPSTVLKLWSGTKAQFDAILAKVSNVIYNVTDAGKLYVGSNLIANLSYTANLLDFKWSDRAMNDVSWLRADQFSWYSGVTYSEAYNHLVADITDRELLTETIAGYTVSYYRAADGHKVVLSGMESTVADIYSATGIAWYYILDTANTQFKLPRTKFGFEGFRDYVGNYVTESLPNITGIKPDWIGDAGFSGAFYNTSTASHGTANSPLSNPSTQGVGFDASLSSSTYQNNAPVQERATQMYLYFYVGEFSQSAIEQTAGITSETLANKVDVDLENMSASSLAKQRIANWLMPDYSATISLAKQNGAVSTNGYLIVTSSTNVSLTNPLITIDGVGFNFSASYGNLDEQMIPVSKNSTYTSTQWNLIDNIRFVPLKGAN